MNYLPDMWFADPVLRKPMSHHLLLIWGAVHITNVDVPFVEILQEHPFIWEQRQLSATVVIVLFVPL